jgi:hypothetical protein
MTGDRAPALPSGFKKFPLDKMKKQHKMTLPY